MTPVEMQPTVSYSVAVSLPGTSSAVAAAEAGYAGPSVVAANTEEEKAPASGSVGHQQLTIAETHYYPQTSGPTPPQFQLQSQAPPQFQLQSQAPPQFQLQSQAPPQFQLQSQAAPQFQLQSQAPPSYEAAVLQQQQQQQQQPLTMSASAIYPSGQQALLMVPGFAATNAAAATSADMTVWMPRPIVTTHCPPGLEYFAELSQLIFLDETSTIPPELWSTENPPRRFSVRNAQGQQIYVAETMNYETAWSAVLGFLDRTGQVLMTVTMKRNSCPICCTGKCRECLLDGTVEAPPGIVVGTVQQRLSGGNVSFVIKNTEGSPVLYLEGPNPCSFCTDGSSWLPNSPYRPFKILSLDRQHQLGKIEAQPSVYVSYYDRLLTNATLAFPADLDVKVKATLAGGATMLHRYFFGIDGGSSSPSGNYRSRPTRPFNNTVNHFPHHLQNHRSHFPHHARHMSRNTSHFGNHTSRSSHHSSSHTSHHSRRH